MKKKKQLVGVFVLKYMAEDDEEGEEVEEVEPVREDLCE